MNNYVQKAIEMEKRRMTDEIMRAAESLIRNLESGGDQKAIWKGFRKKIRRIL